MKIFIPYDGMFSDLVASSSIENIENMAASSKNSVFANNSTAPKSLSKPVVKSIEILQSPQQKRHSAPEALQFNTGK